MAARSKTAALLTIDDALAVLDKLGAQRLEKLILVGGQAAAFWIARYGIADPRLVTTKDIDLLLSERQPGVVVGCARDLSGKLLIIKEPRVPDVAQIRYVAHGAELQIDFLRSLYGLSASDVVSSRLRIIDERASGKTLYIMHPVLVLTSRLFNTFELPGRLTDANLSRLRFSIDAVRAYLVEQLAAGAVPKKDVLPSIERIFRLARCRSGLCAWHEQKIDLLSAVPNKSGLSRCPPQFLETRYPQMLRDLETKRDPQSQLRGPTRKSTGIKKP